MNGMMSFRSLIILITLAALGACGSSGGVGGGTTSLSFLPFVGNNGMDGFELWKSDGTAAGTQMIKDINPMGGVGNGVSLLLLAR